MSSPGDQVSPEEKAAGGASEQVRSLSTTEGEIFLLEQRLCSTQESIKRTRLALFFCVVGALSSLVCLWNTMFSVDRLSSFRLVDLHNQKSRDDGKGEIILPKADDVQAELTKAFVDNWMESTYINIALLGLKVSVSDFSFYNSNAMLLLMLYLLLSERRENREIGRLFQSVVKGHFNVGRKGYLPNTVYRSVMSYMVFNLARKADDPIESIHSDKKPKNEPPLRSLRRKLSFAKRRLRRTIYNIWIKIVTPLPHWAKRVADKITSVILSKGKIRLLRELVYAMFYLPFLSIALNLAYHLHFIRYTGFPWHVPRLSKLWVPLLIWESFCLLYVAYLTWKVQKFHKCTKGLVDEFKEWSLDAEKLIDGAGV